ncbi:MAG: hypothetical protein KDC92_12980 [Bacteroidetes bacterium]|nr:hypothetical protein [Bacteroidota bacterium]
MIFILVLAILDSTGQCSLVGTRGENRLVDSDKYPYTTFYRNDPNGSFNYHRSLNDAIDIFRNRLASLVIVGKAAEETELQDRIPYNVYAQLYNLATGQTNSYNTAVKETKGQEGFREQLKARGFILLCAVDLNGNALPSQTLDDLRDDIEAMFASIDYNYGLFDGTVSNSHYVSKNLIHYLQAYDYLMTDAMLSGDQNRIKEVQCIGNDLQKLVGEYFIANKMPNFKLSTLYRNNDNHTLQTAAVLGLASVVLNQHTHNRLHPNRHPSKWCRTAMWRIDKTMWEGLGRNESDGHGFAEGPYYFKYSFENLAPYFMALKNGHEDERINRYAVPYFNLKGYTSPIGLATGRYIKYNFVDDPEYNELFEWANEIQEPNGQLPTVDNSWPGTTFIGLAGFRNLDWCSNPNMDFENLGNAHVDLRAEFVAAAVDGFYKRIFEKQQTAFKEDIRFDDYSMIIRSSNNAEDMTDMHYLYTNNVRSHNNWLNHKYEHNHHDIGSFLLTVGESKLIIDPYFYGYTFRGEVDKAWSHNTIFMQDDPPYGGFTDLKPNTGGVRIPGYDPIGGYRTATLRNLQFEGDAKYKANREFIVKDYKDYLYIIRDNIEYDGNAIHSNLADNRFSIFLHGNGFTGTYQDRVNGATTADSSFLLELFNGDSLKATWSKPCLGPDSANAYGVVAYFTGHTKGSSANFSSSKLNMSFPVPENADVSTYYQHHNGMQVYIENSEKVQFRTILAPYRCKAGPSNFDIIDSNDILALWVAKRQIGEEKCAVAFNESNGPHNCFYRNTISGYGVVTGLIEPTD